MKKKILLISLISLFVFLIGLSFVEAANPIPTLTFGGVAPTFLTGNNFTYFNITIANPENISNCTILFKSASTGNNSYINSITNNFYVFNVTANASSFNDTFAIKYLDIYEDSNDYSAIATCDSFNASNYNSSAVTSLTLDYTIPTKPTLSSPLDKTEQRDNDVTFSANVNLTSVTSCSLKANQKTGSGSAGATSSSCSIKLKDLPEDRYDWYITANDGTNTTSSSVWELLITGSDTPGRMAALILQSSEEWEKQGKTQFLSIGNGVGMDDAIVNLVKNGWWWMLIVGAAVTIFIVKKYKRK